MTITTRRAFFSTAAAAVGSVAIVSGLAAAAMPEAPTACPADAGTLTLWADRQAAVDRLRAASDAHREASDKLPAWAKPGHRMIDWEGKPYGDEVGWPLDETVKPSPRKGCYRVTRPTPAECRDHFAFAVRTFGLKGKARRDARDRMNSKIAVINARVDAREVLYEQSGMTELERQSDAACDDISTAEAAIFDIVDNSPNVVAARLMIAVCDNSLQADVAEGNGYSGAMKLALVALAPLVPNLSGLIRDHAAFFVANPTLPLGSMPFASV